MAYINLGGKICGEIPDEMARSIIAEIRASEKTDYEKMRRVSDELKVRILSRKLLESRIIMKQKEIEKQRLIGKQLMLVDLIHEENDSNTGFSFVSKDDLSKWSRIEKEEIIKLINTCAYMDDFTMQCNAAKDLAYHKDGSVGSNAYLFYLSTYRRFWYFALMLIDKDSIDEYSHKNAQKNYEEYMKKHQEYPVDEGMANAEFFKNVLEHYVRWFVDCFNNALEDGYDWDVVTRMARIDLSQERFKVLEQI